jgi:type VI secretion system protein ImpL
MREWSWRRFLWAGVLSLVAGAAFWFFAGWWSEEALGWRPWVVCGLLCAWLGWTLIWPLGGYARGRWQARRAALHAVAAEAPQGGVALLARKLEQALATLKSSRLALPGGRAGQLPWFMVVGHPGAGKSSLIRHSGLNFPLAPDQAGQEPAPTANCDWLFASEAVFLDTSGHYITQAELQPEWRGLLGLLRRKRPAKPINGVVVTLSLPEVLQHETPAFASYARQLRARLHELKQSLGLEVPVYLVITKMDLLGGFASYFSQAGLTLGDEIWGASLDDEQLLRQQPASLLEQEFELLYRGLVQQGEALLAGQRGAQPETSLFAFPMEFHGLKQGVSRFVELLLEDDPYHASPWLRGFYFSSAHQQAGVRQTVTGRVQQRFELRSPAHLPAAVPLHRSLFIQPLLRRLVLPERDLGRVDRTRTERGRAWVMAGACLGAILFGFWLTQAYLLQREQFNALGRETAQIQTLEQQSDLYARLQALELRRNRLQSLEQARAGMGWAGWEAWGLPQPLALEPALRSAYFERLEQWMLQPVKQNLEATLAALAKPRPQPRAPRSGSNLPNIDLDGMGWGAAGESARANIRPLAGARGAVSKVSTGAPQPDEAYRALKAYLMLADQARMDARFLRPELARYWRPSLEKAKERRGLEALEQLAASQVDFYLSQIRAADLPTIKTDPQVLALARTQLRGAYQQVTTDERLFAAIRAEANSRFSPLPLKRIVMGRDAEWIKGQAVVEAAFTREAWEGYVKGAIDEASRQNAGADDWVLVATRQDAKERDGDIERRKSALLALYKGAYISAWRDFLASLETREFHTPAEGAALLARLSDKQNSPLKLLLLKTASETSWDNPSELNRSLEVAKHSILDKTTEFLKGGAPAAGVNMRVEPVLGEVGGAFAGVTNLVRGDDPPIDVYLEHLARLRTRLGTIAASDDQGALARAALQASLSGNASELMDCVNFAENSLLPQMSSDTGELLRPLFVQHLERVYGALLEPVQQDVNQAWATEVLPQWRQLASKYPFSDGGSTASFAEINRFAKPNDGVLDRFISKYLNGLVVRKGETLVVRAWRNRGLQLNPEFLNSLSRLQAYAIQPLQEGEVSRFELQVVPTPGLAEIAVNVDGQELKYRNGPQVWQRFVWPQPEAGTGARIQVVSNGGVSSTFVSQAGSMGFMRLLGNARVVQESGELVQLSWSSGRSGEDQVRLNLRVVSGLNPLMLMKLNRMSWPDRILI